MEQPEIVAIPQRCGTCEHIHAGHVQRTGSLPACDTCGCAAFTLHADELAAADAAEAADAADFPNGRLLSGDMARGLHGVVVALEAQLDAEAGWDAPPLIGALYAGPPVAHEGAAPGAALMSIAVAPLDLDYANLAQVACGDVTIAATMLADMAERAPSLFDNFRLNAGGVDPRRPVMAWWAAYEAYLRPDGGKCTDEIRVVFCVDADERVHEVARRRSSGEVREAVDALPRYTAEVTDLIAAEGAARMYRTSGRGIPPLTDALLRLMRVTRTEAFLTATGRTMPENT